MSSIIMRMKERVISNSDKLVFLIVSIFFAVALFGIRLSGDDIEFMKVGGGGTIIGMRALVCIQYGQVEFL